MDSASSGSWIRTAFQVLLKTNNNNSTSRRTSLTRTLMDAVLDPSSTFSSLSEFGLFLLRDPQLLGLLGLMGYAGFYFYSIAKPTIFHYHPDSPYRDILHRCKKLRVFVPAFLLSNSHAQTLGSKFIRASPEINYTRDLVESEEGAIIALDWENISVGFQKENPKEEHEAPDGSSESEGQSKPDQDLCERNTDPSSLSIKSNNRDGTPIVLILHGLVGSSLSKYVKHCVLSVREKGWTAVVMNARGCGSSPLMTHKMFNGECTVDLKRVVEHIHSKYPHSPLLVIAYSLGANILSKYLGESQEKTPVVAAVSISNPFNFALANKLCANNRGFVIYNRGLAKDLTNYVEKHIEVFKKSGLELDLQHISQSRSIQEFDERCVIKLFGYRTLDEYYTAASCLHTLPSVKVPLLFLNATDDPFIHPSIVPHHLAKENPNLMFAVTQRGGHIGFLQNGQFWKRSWADEAGLEFLEHVLNTKRS